ncbi:GNAT family N-acetyltransferase [Aeromicrobium fastidiosum]|uniref:N-acetyltransferase n=1 Tax=Aeromicrobium fastidiosum TaxID=52699 RepID=A0A641AUC5_9ACTN|nr:GNAT family N-acetyltransferase [Aeromicrobium fastidiosum]KAA1380823.1 N-acetyltransferase [Aeromicrobium fastidiosum]MBP2390447.1 putative GNAT family acetyltransferase [Aeromicrobium fastidiosum]
MTNSVSHNVDKQRYEIHVDGAFAGLTQALEDGEVVTMPHTKIFDEFEGQGLATQLVTGALDDIRARGKKIVAECPYVAQFVVKHPEYADLLA